jgi:hypothetical protein
VQLDSCRTNDFAKLKGGAYWIDVEEVRSIEVSKICDISDLSFFFVVICNPFFRLKS